MATTSLRSPVRLPATAFLALPTPVEPVPRPRLGIGFGFVMSDPKVVGVERAGESYDTHQVLSISIADSESTGESTKLDRFESTADASETALWYPSLTFASSQLSNIIATSRLRNQFRWLSSVLRA
jgi:hypothetical protein